MLKQVSDTNRTVSENFQIQCFFSKWAAIMHVINREIFSDVLRSSGRGSWEE